MRTHKAKWLADKRRWSFDDRPSVDFADRLVGATCWAGALFVVVVLVWERV